MVQNQRLLTESLLIVIALLGSILQTSEARTINAKYGLYASQGAFAGDGGQATAASLNFPTSTWLSTDGEAYITEQGNKRIRKVDASGIISSLYGSSSSAVIGTRTPSNVVGDTAGNIYFTDFTSIPVVSKIDTSLSVSVFAGGGTLGTQTTSEDNGAAATSAAKIGKYMCIDTNGNIYLADETYGKIKKVSVSTGILTYVAGTGESVNPGAGDGGPATSAILYFPMGLFIDSVGVLYFSSLSTTIRKIDLMTGIINAFAGGGSYSPTFGIGGPATSAYLDGSLGSFVAGDLDGNIYYCSAAAARVSVIDTSGIINAYAGVGNGVFSGNGGDATAAVLNFPSHIYIYDKTLFISDSGNNVVRTVGMTPDPTAVPSVAPSNAPTTITPTVHPTTVPTLQPSVLPSVVPSLAPSVLPSIVPTVVPSALPSIVPSRCPTVVPTVSPSSEPSVVPTESPSCRPTIKPSLKPTQTPTVRPTAAPTVVPNVSPSESPTVVPSESPSAVPSIAPSVVPTIKPSSYLPSRKPTARPSVRPTRASVTVSPTLLPTVSPTAPIVVISFNSDVTLSNVSASSLDVTSQSAVTSSVAVTLNISTDQVSYVSQQLVGSGGRRVLRAAGVDVYQIEVTVNVVASTADFVDAVNHNGNCLYHLLSDTLTAAVASHAFTRTVREQSAAVGAVSTLYVGYVNVTVSDFTDVTPAVAQHHTSDLSAGEYAGIVIGIVVSFMMVMLACWHGVSVAHQKSIE